MVLQEPIFIDPAGSLRAKPTPGHSEVRTENALVVFRPVPPPAQRQERRRHADGASPPDSPLSAILNASGMVVVDSDDVILSDRRIQDQVLRTGAAGVVIHRILTAGLPAQFAFVASPFFALEPISVPQNSAVHASTSSTLAPSIDPMLWPPALAQAWAPRLDEVYVPAPTDGDLQTDAGDPPPRAAGYRRVERPRSQLASPMHGLETRDLEHTASALAAPQPGTPYRLLVREASAFEDREPLRDGPALDPAPGLESTTSFLPKQLEFHYGPDKPGAMLHHVIAARVALDATATSWSVEPRVDVALRDPQHFILPAGSAILISDDDAPTTKPSPTKFKALVDLGMKWKDVLGQVPVNPPGQPPLATSIAIITTTAGDKLQYDNASSTGLRMILQVHDRLIEFTDDDQAFPMALAPVSPPAVLTPAKLPPRIFVISAVDLTPTLVSQDKQHQYDLNLILTDMGDQSNVLALPLKDVFTQVDLTDPVPPFLLWQLTPDAPSTINWNFANKNGGTFSLNFGWKVTTRKKHMADPPILFVFGTAKRSKDLVFTPPEPKVAAVVSLGLSDNTHFERTVLFGDAASPSLGAGELFLDDASVAQFRYVTADQDTVTLALPPNLALAASRRATASHRIRIIKTLLTGETVAGTHDFAIGRALESYTHDRFRPSRPDQPTIR
jgi:hypothetical protein